jgi:hypothetical protein
MRADDLVDEQLLAKLTDEFKEQTDPKRHQWKVSIKSSPTTAIDE